MPLPLAFTSSNLHSIKEADEEVSLEEDNAEEEDFLAKVRSRSASSSRNKLRSRSLSNPASNSSRAEDNCSRTAERRKGPSTSSLSASSSLSANSSQVSSTNDTVLSELSNLRASVNQLLEAQQQQQMDAKAVEGRNNHVLQLLEESQDQFAAICEGIQNLQAAVANVKPLEDSLRIISDEVKSSNAALASLKVSSERSNTN